jgi:hypothetical protein
MALAVILLFSCTDTIIMDPGLPVHVYDSAWREVDLEALQDRGISRAVESADLSELTDALEAYNAATTDDQLFGPFVGDEVPLDLAPTCDLVIVDSVTNAPELMPGTDQPYIMLDLPREEVEGRRDMWRMQCVALGNATLYVDRDPPPIVAPPVDTRPDYEKYALYLVDGSVSPPVILIEDHCEYIADYPDKLAYFTGRRAAFTMDTYSHQGWFVVSGQLYSPSE